MRFTRAIVVSILILMCLGSVSASQPKILEVTDNFGNTFTFEGDTSGTARVDEEIIVNDETEITLCVTEVKAEDKDSLTYSYWYGNMKPDHEDNTRGDARINDNCRTWDMKKDQYQSSWNFQVWTRNGDDIYYHNDASESDYKAGVWYNNLVLEGETDNTQNYDYETMELSKTEYEELRERPTTDRVTELEDKVEQKNQKISELEDTVTQLKQRVSELNSTLERLNRTDDHSKSGATSSESRDKGIIGSIFGMFG